jgi:hypothetical protein
MSLTTANSIIVTIWQRLALTGFFISDAGHHDPSDLYFECPSLPRLISVQLIKQGQHLTHRLIKPHENGAADDGMADAQLLDMFNGGNP